MNKECAYLCGVNGGIEQVILASMPAVAAEERLAFAPTATRDNYWLLLPFGCQWNRFNHEICAIANELAINAEDGAERDVDLRRRVILGLQTPHGRIDQLAQDWYI
jgi:hypothetical protein